ncbi:energy transducer TonB [Bacteroides sp. 1001136B_160425_E2]|uniref:energy transducer TonB n=1 Tax=Bacteroides sp. 1001136B_160425_E2 TaxID=2787083 RepID=UPI00189CD9FA|nr:energy transducer TonB [Bacteroides sp. 1001136B_160425_E2]
MGKIRFLFYFLILWNINIELCAQQQKFNTLIYYSSLNEIVVELQNLSDNEMTILLDNESCIYFYKNSGRYKSTNLKCYEFEATDSMNVLIKIPPRKMYVGKYKVPCCLLKSYIKIEYSFDFNHSIADCHWEYYSRELRILPYTYQRASTVKREYIKKDNLVGDSVYDKPEVKAEFPGGKKALFNYLSKTTSKYSSSHEQGNIRIRFIVEKDGSISHPYIIKDISPLGKNLFFRKAALEILKQMPKWEPGLKDGKPVRSYYTLSIMFKLI